MKLHHILLSLFLLVTGTVTASAQCSMMGSGGGHKHGGNTATTTHDEHKDHREAPASTKGYAFINDDGNQEATVVIKDGYQPNTIVVKKGIPLRLNFDLQEEGCTATVVFKDFGIKKLLSPYELTPLEFTPNASGEFTFACPMDMIQGTLVVKE